MLNQKDSVGMAEVMAMHANKYCQNNKLTPEQYKVIHAIQNCRTSVLGGHVDQCDQCMELHISYNSCRNRHCPKCQSLRTAKWLDARRRDLLPVPYFHIVFTLPHELNNLILYNKKLLHGLLFQSAWGVLNTLGKDPKRLDGLMGMIGILHTWGQALSLHNHLHCIVPGGALAKDGKWKPSKKGYLFPVKVMSKLFKGIFIAKLKKMYKNKLLNLHPLKDASFDQLVSNVMKKNWVIYAKKPFAGPEKLLGYLGRYTHKIAISNHRILACDDNSVTFQWRDYSDGNKIKVMKLDANEFIRRFLQHIVPKTFMRIRMFGFLANACKTSNIEKIRMHFSYVKPPSTADKKDAKSLMIELTGIDISICPSCKKGKLRTVQQIQSKFSKVIFDTS